MFPLWEAAIAPVLRAVRPRRVVEIGALRGETTTLMLDFLGPGVELHVVDPVPEFDPSEHERQFVGRYFFHRAISHDVLPTLGAVDAALVDGDHNWFTVYHELRMLAAASRAEGKPLPLIVLHDVGWPYGRRDLYYSPERIPAEHRQPYRQAGMRPGVAELVESNGLNPTMWNAELEGGPRNGVMTAVDDFVAEHDRAARVVVLPIYFGLAIVADEDLLAAKPELVDALDELETEPGLRRLLPVAEDVRLQAMLFQHHVFFEREAQLDGAADRYVSLLTAALRAEATFDAARLQRLHDELDVIRREQVQGAVVLLAPDDPATVAFLRAYLGARGLRRTVWVCGAPPAAGSAIRAALERLDLLDRQVRFVDDPSEIEAPRISMLRVGARNAVITGVEPRVATGGFIVDEPSGRVTRKGVPEGLLEATAG